ncbi:Uncharacterised protein [Bordetella pertussis]|nr:Uncharacterised protein [Bordetella pertussis]
MARRKLAAHAQSALHARRTAGRAGGELPGRRILAGPVEGHRRHHQRAPGQARHPPLLQLPAVDAQPWRTVSELAVRNLAPGPYQRILHGRRQGPGQRVLSQRRRPRDTGALRHAGGGHRARRRALRGRRPGRRRPHRGRQLRTSGRRLRVQPGLARPGLGHQRERRKARAAIPHPRHPVQPGRAVAAHARQRGRRHRRPHPGPYGGHRRALPVVRRRHLHPHRLRTAGHRGQPRRPALL